MKILQRCEGCRKRRIIIRKQTVKLPTGAVAKSQKFLCTPCILAVRKAIELV